MQYSYLIFQILFLFHLFFYLLKTLTSHNLGLHNISKNIEIDSNENEDFYENMFSYSPKEDYMRPQGYK